MTQAYMDFSGSIAGLPIRGRTARSASGGIGHELSLPAAIAGELTTRTDNDTGVVTVAAHTITTQDTVNLFWTDANGNVLRRFGCTVTAVGGTTVSIDAGSGDNLPALNSAVTIAKQIHVDVDFTGDLTVMAAMVSQRLAHVDFQEADNSSIISGGVLLLAGEVWTWIFGQGVASPFADALVDHLLISSGDATATSDFSLGVMVDSLA